MLNIAAIQIPRAPKIYENSGITNLNNKIRQENMNTVLQQKQKKSSQLGLLRSSF